MKGGTHDSTAAGGRTGLPGRVAAVSQSGAAESVRMPMTAEPNGTRQASRPDQREAPARATAARGLRRGEAPATCRQLMGGHDAEAPRRRGVEASRHRGAGALGHWGTPETRGGLPGALGHRRLAGPPGSRRLLGLLGSRDCRAARLPRLLLSRDALAPGPGLAGTLKPPGLRGPLRPPGRQRPAAPLGLPEAAGAPRLRGLPGLRADAGCLRLRASRPWPCGGSRPRASRGASRHRARRSAQSCRTRRAVRARLNSTTSAGRARERPVSCSQRRRRLRTVLRWQ